MQQQQQPVPLSFPSSFWGTSNKAGGEIRRGGPSTHDVICARGRDATRHPGNQRFREMILANKEPYAQASSKLEKTIIVNHIIDQVRDCGGWFVRQDAKTGGWFEVGDVVAREKIGQRFRDLLHSKYQSSTKSKYVKKQRLASLKKRDSVTSVDTSTSTNSHHEEEDGNASLSTPVSFSNLSLQDLQSYVSAAASVTDDSDHSDHTSVSSSDDESEHQSSWSAAASPQHDCNHNNNDDLPFFHEVTDAELDQLFKADIDDIQVASEQQQVNDKNDDDVDELLMACCNEPILAAACSWSSMTNSSCWNQNNNQHQEANAMMTISSDWQY